MNELEIKEPVALNSSVAACVSWDPSWEALQEGSPIELKPDVLDFMLLRARPAENSTILLRYRGTLEENTMAGVGVAADPDSSGLRVAERFILHRAILSRAAASWLSA